MQGAVVPQLFGAPAWPDRLHQLPAERTGITGVPNTNMKKVLQGYLAHSEEPLQPAHKKLPLR